MVRTGFPVVLPERFQKQLTLPRVRMQIKSTKEQLWVASQNEREPLGQTQVVDIDQTIPRNRDVNRETRFIS